MTHIVSPSKFPTKKSLREAVKAGTRVYVTDPAIIGAINGELREVLALCEQRGDKHGFTVTNHPKRSWFAQITRNAKGEVVVK